MRKHIAAAFLIAAQFSLGLSFVPTVHADSTVIISAVQTTGGAGKTSEDFVELYNPGNESFNLKGHRLVKRSGTGAADSSIKSWTEDTFIPAHSFYLWANGEFTTISMTPDLVSTATLADNNGVAIRLGAADTGTIIDSMAWGTANNGFNNVSSINPGAGASLSRVNLFDTSDGYSIGASHPRNSTVQFLPPNPEPTPTPSPTPTGVVTPTPSASPTPSVTPTPTATPTVPSCVVPTPTPTPTVVVTVTPTPLPTATPVPTATPTPVATVTPTPLVTPTPWVTPTPSTTPTPVNPTPTPVSANTVRINEFIPDPAGTDTGAEKIELYNYGETAFNLVGWILDDISPTDAISSNSYTLPSTNIAAKGYAVITIPSGKFALNNTGGDVLTLLNPAKKVVDNAFYQGTAHEGQSYSYFESGWKWTESTFGAVNVAPSEETLQPFELVITEIYAAPGPNGGQEFIEIYNPEDTSVDLGRVTIQVGEKTKTLPTQDFGSKKFMIILGKQLPAGLKDDGQTVKVSRDKTIELDSVTYPKSRKGESYSLFEDGFLWTASVTPGAENALVVPQAEKSKTVSAQTENTEAVVTKKTLVPVSSSPSKDGEVIPAVAGMTSDDNQSPPNDQQSGSANSVESSDGSSGSGNSRRNLLLTLSLGAAAVGGSMFVIYRFGLREPQVNF